MSRLLAAGLNAFHEGQLPISLVDGKYGDAVIATVRNVQKFPGHIGCDLRRRVLSLEALRKRRDGLQLRESPRRIIKGIHNEHVGTGTSPGSSAA